MRRPLPRAETYKKHPRDRERVPGVFFVQRRPSGHVQQGTGESLPLWEDEAEGAAGAAWIEDPEAVRFLEAAGAVGVAEEQKVGPGVPGRRRAASYPCFTCQMCPWERRTRLPHTMNLALQRICGPAVAVAGHGDHGQLGIEEGQLLGVPAGGRPGGPPGRAAAPRWPGSCRRCSGGSRKTQEFSKESPYLVWRIYWNEILLEGRSGMNQERSGKKGQESLPADLVKNKEALNRLARSGDAQRLMELLRQGGGIQGAAEAAVKGDTSQLVG